MWIYTSGASGPGLLSAEGPLPLPSGTGSAPSQREGCHLQHCEQLFLQHHGFSWTSPSEELIRSSHLKWKLGDPSMTEVDNVLKLFGFLVWFCWGFFALQMQRYTLSNRFLAFISLVSYCCSVFPLLLCLHVSTIKTTALP